MDEVESFGRMRQCIWLQAIPSTVDYLPLDLLLCKHMGSCNISLDVPWCQGTVLASFLFSSPPLLVTRWLDSILQGLMGWHQKEKGMNGKKCFSPWAPLLQEVNYFPSPLRGRPLVTGQKRATCPSLQSLSNGNGLPRVAWTPRASRKVKWEWPLWRLALKFLKTQAWSTTSRGRTWGSGKRTGTSAGGVGQVVPLTWQEGSEMVLRVEWSQDVNKNEDWAKTQEGDNEVVVRELEEQFFPLNAWVESRRSWS